MDDSCDLFVLFKQYPSGGTVWLMLGLETIGSDYLMGPACGYYIKLKADESLDSPVCSESVESLLQM